MTRWIDDELSEDERLEMEALLEKEPELKEELTQMREMGPVLREVIPAEKEPPHADFFNTHLMNQIRREQANPAVKKTPWWGRLHGGWIPASALAAVLAFFAGMKLSSPPKTSEAGIPLVASPMVYAVGDSLQTEVIAALDGSVSVIVMDGLADVDDALELASLSTASYEEFWAGK